jgi:hypothetical protein
MQNFPLPNQLRMKKILLFASLLPFLLAACSRSGFELPQPGSPAQPVIINTAATTYFRFKINGQWYAADSIVKTRSTGGKTLDIKAKAGEWNIHIPVQHILQTGNATGLILVGSYSLFLEKKRGEVQEPYTTLSKTLLIYNDNPLTDSVVTGRFYFDAVPATGGETLKVTDGDFRLRF